MPQLPVAVRASAPRGSALPAPWPWPFLATRSAGCPLLVEKLEQGRAVGHSEQFAPLRLDREAPIGASSPRYPFGGWRPTGRPAGGMSDIAGDTAAPKRGWLRGCATASAAPRPS